MKKYVFICFAILALMSCKWRKSDSVYIPRDRFVEILTDIHLADAYYSTHYDQGKSHNDSVNFYNRILKNYGYTRAQFDTTLKFYSVNTEKFDQIYEDVVTRLNKTEQDNYLVRPVDTELSQNIWYDKNSWYLPQEGNQKKIPVSLKLKGKGKYVINFTYKVYPDDQSRNLRLNLYFSRDSSSKPKIDTLKAIVYEKDARTAIATITKELKDSTFTYLKGYLLDHDNKKGKWKKHVVIEGFKVYFMPKK